MFGCERVFASPKERPPAGLVLRVIADYKCFLLDFVMLLAPLELDGGLELALE
jgi:hypothetical protein